MEEEADLEGGEGEVKVEEFAEEEEARGEEAKVEEAKAVRVVVKAEMVV